MENYSFNSSSYPESGDSSPRSREIDFDNPQPWDEHSNNSYKVKFMCSYGGKIQPRPHDNQLSYVGGDTKILVVDRSIKFSSLLAKLSSISDSDVTFKYQLPGEDLDALISVTNDDDLDHMMHEYDRLYRGSAKPARMRLFLFPVNSTPGFASSVDEVRSDRERFVDALNSGSADPAEATKPSTPINNFDFLFGLEKGSVPPPMPVAEQKLHDTVPEAVAPPTEFTTRPGQADRHQIDMQRQLHELQRLQIAEHEQAMYRRSRSDEINQVGGGYGAAGDYYMHKVMEKSPAATSQPTMPSSAGYWPENQFSSGGFQAVTTDQQPMYVISASGTVYQTPSPPPHMMRPVTGQTSQGYYAVQGRMASDVYRDQPVYNVVQQPPHQQTLPQQPPKVSAADPPLTYTQVAYDSTTGRHVYYTAGGGAVAPPPQYQGVQTNVSGEIRQQVGAPVAQDGKFVPKASQGTT